MSRRAPLAALCAGLALASCTPTYTPTWGTAWTPAAAKATIVEVQQRMLRQRQHPETGVGYPLALGRKDFAATDQHFTTEGLPPPHTAADYVTGPLKLNYSDIDRVLIVPNRINSWLPTVLTLGIVGPHWGRTLRLTLKQDNKAVCVADVGAGGDWWKNVFPCWAIFPGGPTRTDAHRLGAAIDYMAHGARPAAQPPAKKAK